MGLTTDPNDPGLKRSVGKIDGVGQNEAYLVLSDEERAKGFVRPVRTRYVHAGPPGPQYELRDLTPEEQEWLDCCGHGYVRFEPYPACMSPRMGRYWTQEELDRVGRGCGVETTMARPIAETYARNPKFYGSTFCCRCGQHFPVEEFIWDDGTRVGS